MVVFKLEQTSESPVNPVKTQPLSPTFRISDSTGLEWGPRICTSNRFPGAAAAGRNTVLSESLFWNLATQSAAHPPAASASPGSLLEMQILRPHPPAYWIWKFILRRSPHDPYAIKIWETRLWKSLVVEAWLLTLQRLQQKTTLTWVDSHGPTTLPIRLCNSFNLQAWSPNFHSQPQAG